MNIFRSSTFIRKYQSFYIRFCNATVLLRWSLQYGRRWLQFPKNIDAQSSPNFDISGQPSSVFSWLALESVVAISGEVTTSARHVARMLRLPRRTFCCTVIKLTTRKACSPGSTRRLARAYRVDCKALCCEFIDSRGKALDFLQQCRNQSFLSVVAWLVNHRVDASRGRTR